MTTRLNTSIDSQKTSIKSEVKTDSTIILCPGPDFDAIVPGGLEVFTRYVSEHFNIPENTGLDSVHIGARFYVNTLGKIDSVRPLTESVVTEPLINELKRVLLNSPPWIPGMREGRYIQSLYQTEIIISPVHYAKVDVACAFPGGEESWRNFIKNKLVYPMRCRDADITGKVELRFVVDYRGMISRITVIDSTAACPEFTKEAIRVLKMSPRWLPAQDKGQFVNSWRQLPIVFSLD